MTKQKAKFEKPWTKFERAFLREDQLDDIRKSGNDPPTACYINSRYEVWIYVWHPKDESGAVLKQLSIKRRDKSPIHRWRDLQRIKNEILGPNVEAVELYPSEKRLVDTANQYHLWCLPEGMVFPFGYKERLVMEGASLGAVQEPWEDDARPSDLTDSPMTMEEAREIADKLLSQRNTYI